MGKETLKREGCGREQAAEAFQAAFEDGGYAVIIEKNGKAMTLKRMMAEFGITKEEYAKYIYKQNSAKAGSRRKNR